MKTRLLIMFMTLLSLTSSSKKCICNRPYVVNTIGDTLNIINSPYPLETWSDKTIYFLNDTIKPFDDSVDYRMKLLIKN